MKLPSWFKLPSWLQGGAWMSNTQVLAAGCHFLVSSLPLVLLFLFGATSLLLKCVSVGIILFALVKEFIYDANWEVPHQTFQMNLQDFLGYCAGTAFAWLVITEKVIGIVYVAKLSAFAAKLWGYL